MNLFRSEEHARNWTGFGDEAGLLPLEDLLTIYNIARYRERLNGEYITNLPEYMKERAVVHKAVTKDHPFWRRA